MSVPEKPIQYRKIRFQVFLDTTTHMYPLHIPQLIDGSSNVIHTRLRAFSEDGKVASFTLRVHDETLGSSTNGVLDIGPLYSESAIIRYAQDSDLAENYRHFGVNLNCIDELHLSFAHSGHAYFVEAEMMTR